MTGGSQQPIRGGGHAYGSPGLPWWENYKRKRLDSGEYTINCYQALQDSQRKKGKTGVPGPAVRER